MAPVRDSHGYAHPGAALRHNARPSARLPDHKERTMNLMRGAADFLAL
jgi:hypothetical protein